ncbi:hypothetical protein [Pyxidicoccus trucidator]|uniref:hypothetical protein n=1 Tax=Pyxidicoccus trucidator TaxID=2709662 RepID=UPI001967B7C2|nr:hypothetical protein [Pyxidicoccus trucidator]
MTWYWGLTSNFGYYSFSGDWVQTPYTNVLKFRSTTPYSELCAACNNAKAYYGVPGNLYAFFASTSGWGSNYPIVLGGNELFSTL